MSKNAVDVAKDHTYGRGLTPFVMQFFHHSNA